MVRAIARSPRSIVASIAGRFALVMVTSVTFQRERAMPTKAVFSATASQLDLSLDFRMGRKMAGFIGIGTIDVRDDGIVVEARRHRYGVNFIGGAVLGVLAFVGFIVLGMEVPKQGPSSTSSAWVAGLFGFVLGAWIVSLSARWSRPVQLVIPPGLSNRSTSSSIWFGSSPLRETSSSQPRDRRLPPSRPS